MSSHTISYIQNNISLSAGFTVSTNTALKTEGKNTEESTQAQWPVNTIKRHSETFHCFLGTEFSPSDNPGTIPTLTSSRTRIITSFTVLAGLSSKNKNTCKVLDNKHFLFF